MSNDINRIKEMKGDFIDAMIGYGVQYETCGKISAALNAAIESLAATAPPVLAAPANSAVLPELPEPFDTLIPQRVRVWRVDQLREYGQACAESALAASAPKVQMTDAEIAKQWKVSCQDHGDTTQDIVRHFARAIAARSAPNAELVEALKDIVALKGTEDNEWDAVERVIPEMIAVARAALAAVGEA